MTGPRDWDKELAAIDKVIARTQSTPGSPAPAAPPQLPVSQRGGQPAPAGAGVAAPAHVTRRRDTMGVWFRALLGAAGAAALPFWPYGKTCGLVLGLYMTGTVAVAAAGIWTMRGAWTHRRGGAMTAGVLVLLAGLGLGGIEVLRRTAFAAVPLHWICP